MKLDLFDYHLPKNLIAQTLIKPRGHSRLMVLDLAAQAGRKNKSWQHDYFYNLPDYLDENDVLVFNDSKVIPARLMMYKPTGGKVEVFLLNDLKEGNWEVLLGRYRPSSHIQELSQSKLKCQIIKKLGESNWQVKFNYAGKKFKEMVYKIGKTPLPPYIKVNDSKQVRRDYQTTYAKKEGSCAAPTAGFHFTRRLFNKLKKKGIKIEFITLHVGLGTFQPVKTKKIENHHIHAELATINQRTADRLNKYKQQAKRIIAVGTTSCRALEAFAVPIRRRHSPECSGSPLRKVVYKIKPQSKWVDIFIYPGHKFKFVDGLITNFHLPKSTLLMLVSALTGRKFILNAYQEAIKEKYRFYSFGDGMLIQ